MSDEAIATDTADGSPSGAAGAGDGSASDPMVEWARTHLRVYVDQWWRWWLIAYSWCDSSPCVIADRVAMTSSTSVFAI